MRAAMLPLVPSYAAAAALDDHVLGIVRFGAKTSLDGGILTLALPPLGASAAEVWRSPAPVVRGESGGIAFAHNGEVLFGAMAWNDGAVATGARHVYECVVQAIRKEGFPYLLRVWNHVRDINSGAGDEERYRRFCAGRHEALTVAGFQKQEFPSASAVGMIDGSLAMYFIASRTPGRQIENPRQVSAYEYPREYGPRSPSFARATVAQFGGEEIVFVSGTASVVGHETRHIDDVPMQICETITNLNAVVERSGRIAADVRLMKIYVRRGADPDPIAAKLSSAFAAASLLVVESDICRRDLLLEVEAIALR